MLATRSSGSVQSVFGRVGVIVAAAGDYAVNQVTGAAPLASPALTGNPTAPTPATSDNSTALATTAYVQAQGYLTVAPVTSVCGNTGAITEAELVAAGLAPLASPTFTGTPVGPTATVGTNTTQLATCAFVLANSSTPAGSTDQIQFNGGTGFGASSSLTWNPADSNITIGTALVGGWHFASSYLVVGNSALNQTVNGNYALIQSNSGVTSLNSAGSGNLNLCANNVAFAVFNYNAAISGLFNTNSASANWVWQGAASQTAPLHALRGVSSTLANRDIGYLDAGFSSSTDASYKGYIRLCAQDFNAVSGGREGVRVGSSGTAAELGFYGATPVIQPTAGGVTTGYTSGTSTTVTIDGKFTGGTGSSKYTIGDVVAALKAVGLLAP